jgi:hypothetical protein
MIDIKKIKSLKDVADLFKPKSEGGSAVVTPHGVYEVNLVPDVKAKLLHAQRLRNVVIFFSLAVAAGGVTVVLVLASVVGGQNIVLGMKDEEMTNKSEEIMNFTNLNQVLTIQDQLNKISEINSGKKLLSRVFGVMDVILPSYAMGDEDDVQMEELSVDLAAGTLSFDGHGESMNDIDYRALEAFKKTVGLSYYDFGRYVDKNGKDIPTMCITERIEDYVVWGIYHTKMKGCGLEGEDGEYTDEEAYVEDEDEDEDEDVEEGEDVEDEDEEEEGKLKEGDILIKRDMTLEELNGAKNKSDYYFRSECVEYWDEKKQPTMMGGSGANAKCMLAAQPVAVRDSRNGKDSSSKLVLRFSAVVTVNVAVFDFANKHVRVIGPARQNVTDSYLQVRDMFDGSEDCAPDDEKCLNANGGGGEDG